MSPLKNGESPIAPARPDLIYMATKSLTPYANNARTHSRKQIKQIAASIERFGFTNPVLIADDGQIIAGHGRVEAAKLMGLTEVPVLKLSHLSDAERRAYVLADNKLAENAGWDRDLLAIELQGLIDLDFDPELTGFSLAEIDLTLDAVGSARHGGGTDEVRILASQPPVTRLGDIWEVGGHRIMCGDALEPADLTRLMAGQTAQMAFTDPPYNVPIDGHVSGLGQHKHREFVYASGEMSREAFTAFLRRSFENMASVMTDGAIAFVCMDWRHMGEILAAGETSFTELKNLCVWNKTNAGMGTFYRSKHELVFVFKHGRAPHVNSFGLGDTGRYRTNVWDYAGANVVGAARDDDLAMHPTVKPVAMIRDAIQDCSKRGGLVLDVFGGVGSTHLAAEACGRRAHIMEIDPIYVDTTLRRFEAETGQVARHVDTGVDFASATAAGQNAEVVQ